MTRGHTDCVNVGPIKSRLVGPRHQMSSRNQLHHQVYARGLLWSSQAKGFLESLLVVNIDARSTAKKALWNMFLLFFVSLIEKGCDAGRLTWFVCCLICRWSSWMLWFISRCGLPIRLGCDGSCDALRFTQNYEAYMYIIFQKTESQTASMKVGAY